MKKIIGNSFIIIFVPIIITVVCILEQPEPGETNIWIKWIILGILWLISIAILVYMILGENNRRKLKLNNIFLELKILEVIDEEVGILDIEVEIQNGEEKKKLLTSYESKNKISDLIKQKMLEKNITTIKTLINPPNIKIFEMDIGDFLTKLDMEEEIKNLNIAGTGYYDYSKSVKDTL